MTGELSTLSEHGTGVMSVVYDPNTGLVISASWDKTLHLHLPEKVDHEPSTIRLPQKPFSISLSPTRLVVGMAARELHVYNLKSLAMIASQSSQPPPNEVVIEPEQRRQSSLLHMLRAIACMPNDEGYTSSSIEGRIAVDWFDPSNESQAKNYAFKSHRKKEDDVEVIFPVNALAFHPQHGTFATGGGDGSVAIWDGATKRRVKIWQHFPASISAISFSADGKYCAIAVSPGFENGEDVVGEGQIKICLRYLGEDGQQVKPKAPTHR